jgi:hypothetical protein
MIEPQIAGAILDIDVNDTGGHERGSSETFSMLEVAELEPLKNRW